MPKHVCPSPPPNLGFNRVQARPPACFPAQDRALLEGNEEAMLEVARAAQQFIAEEHRRMEEEAAAHQVRGACAALRCALLCSALLR